MGYIILILINTRDVEVNIPSGGFAVNIPSGDVELRIPSGDVALQRLYDSF